MVDGGGEKLDKVSFIVPILHGLCGPEPQPGFCPRRHRAGKTRKFHRAAASRARFIRLLAVWEGKKESPEDPKVFVLQQQRFFCGGRRSSWKTNRLKQTVFVILVRMFGEVLQRCDPIVEHFT